VLKSTFSTQQPGGSEALSVLRFAAASFGGRRLWRSWTVRVDWPTEQWSTWGPVARQVLPVWTGVGEWRLTTDLSFRKNGRAEMKRRERCGVSWDNSTTQRFVNGNPPG